MNRREFSRQALQSLTAMALLEGLAAHRLFGKDVAPIVDDWFKQLDTMSRDLKDHRLKDLDFQKSLEALYGKVDLPSLLRTLDFDRIASGLEYPEHGAKSLPVDFKNVPGLSTGLAFGRQIFAMKKGRSVVPHGHDNMATGFLVLKGNFQGRHWDRVEDHEDFYLIRPTIDRKFAPGECSTVSDRKDNVHWFTANDEVGFLFNIHVMDYNPDNDSTSRRVYVDPKGEKVAGGLIKAPKITYSKANQMYG